jgi:hypothetical protein
LADRRNRNCRVSAREGRHLGRTLEQLAAEEYCRAPVRKRTFARVDSDDGKPRFIDIGRGGLPARPKKRGNKRGAR